MFGRRSRAHPPRTRTRFLLRPWCCPPRVASTRRSTPRTPSRCSLGSPRRRPPEGGAVPVVRSGATSAARPRLFLKRRRRPPRFPPRRVPRARARRIPPRRRLFFSGCFHSSGVETGSGVSRRSRGRSGEVSGRASGRARTYDRAHEPGRSRGRHLPRAPRERRARALPRRPRRQLESGFLKDRRPSPSDLNCATVDRVCGAPRRH